jgi:hypothetical protein
LVDQICLAVVNCAKLGSAQPAKAKFPIINVPSLQHVEFFLNFFYINFCRGRLSFWCILQGVNDMQIKLPFDSSTQIAGEASIDIDKTAEEVFSFVADNFFDNYPKWSTDVVELEPLDSKEVFVGNKAKQLRDDNGSLVESIFEIIEYQPHITFMFQGITSPYKHIYSIKFDAENQKSHLTFRFELLDIDVFMRPFQKLIRIAIEDGAESSVENIKQLLAV